MDDYVRKNKEASMPLRCHDIVPYVTPFLHNDVREHGKTCISWFGPIPKVTIADAELARQVMSSKSGHFEKLQFRKLSRLLAEGVATYEGEKWVKHRRILNPAFHLEKLKLMLPAFSSCCEELVTRWTGSLGSDDGCCEVDVCLEFHSLAGDAISRTAFGSSYLEGKRIFELQSEQADRILASVKIIFIPGYLGQSITGMTIKEVMEECKMFYFVGTETTSILLTWTMILLSMHPEWQDRVREEVLGLFGKNQPEYNGFSRLKTVTSTILYEVLRLYPPSTALVRRTYKEMEIGGITYPAGVLIEMPVLLIHHDPDIWGTDVHEFRPERFGDGISKASNDPSAFLPFGWGPRICIGQSFALLEAKMALCMILQHFDFELAPTYTHAPRNEKLLRPMHGAPIKLRPGH
ncbi:hypothetical protein ACQ4PT_031214 [Festuca glaucescens]